MKTATTFLLSMGLLVDCLSGSARGAMPVAELPGWMAGSWYEEVSGVRMEEHWTSAAGDRMVGMHRDLKPDGRTDFEFLRIERRGGKIAYVSMPGGRAETVFPLKTMTSDRVVFENPSHDFPQRILYWKEGTKLCARIEGSMGGSEASDQWCWSRAATN